MGGTHAPGAPGVSHEGRTIAPHLPFVSSGVNCVATAVAAECSPGGSLYAHWGRAAALCVCHQSRALPKGHPRQRARWRNSRHARVTPPRSSSAPPARMPSGQRATRARSGLSLRRFARGRLLRTTGGRYGSSSPTRALPRIVSAARARAMRSTPDSPSLRPKTSTSSLTPRGDRISRLLPCRGTGHISASHRGPLDR